MHGQEQNIRIVGKLLLQTRQEAGGLALLVQKHGAPHAELTGQTIDILAGGRAEGLLEQRHGFGAAPRQRRQH